MAELIVGASLGFAAGVSPGPLLTLVVVTALERGPAAAIRVAAAPLVTDTAVVAIALLVLTNVPETWLTALTIAGGIYLICLGLSTLVGSPDPQPTAVARDWTRGAMVNVLSPHPWVFWATVGGPVLVEAWRSAPWRGVAFAAGFYVLIVGTKASIGWWVGRTRHRLSPRWRGRIVRAGGVLLTGAGVWLIFG